MLALFTASPGFNVAPSLRSVPHARATVAMMKLSELELLQVFNTVDADHSGFLDETELSKA